MKGDLIDTYIEIARNKYAKIIAIYTADNEYPDCMKCEHVCDDYDCSNFCGGEHSWHGYKRFEFETDRNGNVIIYGSYNKKEI